MRLLATGFNRKGKYLRLDDNSTLPFVEMLDIKGDTTENPDECVSVVFQLPNGKFSGVDLREFSADMEEITQ